MLKLSDTFMQRATEHGRHVWCRVEVGGRQFCDDSIVELEFDDVVHPDWFTFGTACANRLHFTVRFADELQTGSEVRAFISFDGEEWCPLGIFYITRRYVRGSYVSITAYDRMYLLDEVYSYSGALPTTCTEILADIAARCGIALGDVGYAHTVDTLPTEETTVRDMIGYIAAMNGCCAKFDRYGTLVFKDHSVAELTLTDSCCYGFSRNMTRSVVTCIKAQTESEQLQAGDGAEISTIELYDPLMTVTRLEQLLSMMKPYTFYGAELEMQGLPFLEAGDSVYFLDGAMMYPLVISEIEYRYDGGLTATLYSKNKTDTDIVPVDDLENIIADLKEQLHVFALKQCNPSQIQLGEEAVVLADFSFTAAKNSFMQLDVNLTLREYTASGAQFALYVNGEMQPRKPLQVLSEGDTCILHLHELVQPLPEGACNIQVTGRAHNGDAYIFAGELSADVVVHGGLPNSGDVLRASLRDELPCQQVAVQRIVLADISGDVQLT